jgi:hypothetical protein
MAEPVGPESQGASAGQLGQQVRDAPLVDRLTLGTSALILVAAVLPWNGAELLTGGRMGLTASLFALLAILAGVGAGAIVIGRLVGALDLGANAATIGIALGGVCLAGTVLHFFTNSALLSTGFFLTVAGGAFLVYLGLARQRGDTLAAFERPRRRRREKGTPITSQMIMSTVMRAVSIGPIVGSLVAGGAFYPMSHSTFTVLTTTIGMMIVLTGLRLADGVLRPVWVLVGGIPPVLRFPVGIIVPLYISITRASPDAAGLEVESTRTAMFLSVIVVYVLFHGPPKDAAVPPGHAAAGPQPAGPPAAGAPHG